MPSVLYNHGGLILRHHSNDTSHPENNYTNYNTSHHYYKSIIMLLELLLLCILLAAAWYKKSRLPADHPPTPPFRLPIIGHFHHLLLTSPTNKTTALYELFKKYNKNGVLSIFVGTTKITLLGTQPLAKEVFNKEEANARLPYDDLREKFRRPRQNVTGMEGIVLNHGKHWQEQRRFMLSTLRDFGFGKSDMEGLINEEFKFFMEHLDTHMDKVELVQNLFNIPILNILWQIIAGTRYHYYDPNLKELVQKTSDIVNVPFSQADITTFLPMLKDTPLDPGVNEGLAGFVDIKKFLMNEIESHERTLNPDDIRDFIDAYLVQIKNNTSAASSFHESRGYDQLVNSLIDLFIAGTETTSNTLSFAAFFMMCNPEVQEKVRQEIWDVVGKENSISLTDRVNLPFTDATIMEVQRMADVAPEGVFHTTSAPVKAGQYVIPAGHMVMPSLTAIMKSDDQWEEGSKFNPARFLDADGKVVRNEKLIPFSIGKRACPGESLAKAELFLFFAGLMQKCRFEAEDPQNPPEIDVVSGVAMALKPFNMKITRAA